jgi:uncharacterized protein
MHPLVVAGLLYLGFRKLKSLTGPDRRAEARSPEPVEDIMVQDPECGTYIPRREAAPLRWEGRELFFCGTECRDRFVDRHETP